LPRPMSTPTTEPTSRPMLILPSGNVSITKCAGELFTLIAPTKRLFTRGGVVVQVVSQNGVDVLEPLRPAAARSFFEKFAELWAFRTGKNGEPVLKPAICPLQTADALLQSAEAGSLLPRITGLINAPIIREADGKLEVAGPGYDDATGMLITSRATVP